MGQGIILPDNHFFLASALDIAEICDPLLRFLNIKLFTYSRYYKNGELLILPNDNRWLRDYLKNGYLFPIPIPKALRENAESLYIPSIDGPYRQIMHELINIYKSTPGIRLIYNRELYLEILCFTYASNEAGYINNFLNNLDAFKRFATYFRDKAANLIKTAEDNKIMLPNHMRGLDSGHVQSDRVLIANNEFQQSTKINRVCIDGNYGHVRLSQQESRSISFLARGNSIKETAQLLALSPRTIEGYLNSIKLKLGCRTKNEVIRLMTRSNSACA